MALTDAEKQELLNEMKASSNDVSELETVDSLDGIVSLPAMKGEELVNAPISLLRKPAEDAAKVANTAANNANNAGQAALDAGREATDAATLAANAANEATKAATETNAVKENAYKVVVTHEATALAARNGATARFDAIIEAATVKQSSSITSGGRIVYVRSAKVFAYAADGTYFSNALIDGVLILDMYMNSVRSEVLKNKIYLCGATMYVWSDEENDLVEASGNGSGSGFYNLTIEQPLANGYYNIATALRALQIADIDDEAKPGMIMTFEVSAGKWVDYRFCGSSIDNFFNAASWEEYGGGKIKQISVNGQNVTPDAEGKVNIVIDEQEVDTTLDQNSTNPVQNSTVTAKFNEIEAATVFDMSAEVSDDESTVRLALKNKSGAEIAAVDIPAGSGGGGGDASTTKIVLNASVDNPI
ncbi:MAG: head-tail adaptor protein, partial [Bacteroidaceae bacterium]|nr:head-tail adaptor protein [Bacteroidaceae bacterium]